MLSPVYSRSLATLVVPDKSVRNIFRVNFPTNPHLVMWGFAGDFYRSIVPRGGAFNDSTLQIPPIPTSVWRGVGGAWHWQVMRQQTVRLCTMEMHPLWTAMGSESVSGSYQCIKYSIMVCIYQGWPGVRVEKGEWQLWHFWWDTPCWGP